MALISPIQRGLSWTLDGVGGGWSGYVGLRGAYRDNAGLRVENAELREKVAALEEARIENERLKKMLGFAEERAAVPVVAHVIAVSPASTMLSFRIDRGEQDGVRRGMPVVTADGVVGQVLRSVGSTADVLLISDVKSRLGVRVQRSRARGTAGGSGGGRELKLENDGDLRLENVLRTEDLKAGDLIVTAGTDGIFPPGLVVGRAASIKRKLTGMFLTGEIVPAVDLTKVEEVLVLRPGVPPGVAP